MHKIIYHCIRYGCRVAYLVFGKAWVWDMISSQVIKTSIEELHGITKVDLCVFDLDGMVVASTFDAKLVMAGIVTDFRTQSKSTIAQTC